MFKSGLGGISFPTTPRVYYQLTSIATNYSEVYPILRRCRTIPYFNTLPNYTISYALSNYTLPKYIAELYPVWMHYCGRTVVGGQSESSREPVKINYCLTLKLSARLKDLYRLPIAYLDTQGLEAPPPKLICSPINY